MVALADVARAAAWNAEKGWHHITETERKKTQAGIVANLKRKAGMTEGRR